MSLEETRDFLEDLLLRFDPDINLDDGSRAQAELVQPVLDRIGIDPFDEDIATFVRERVRQEFPDLAITDVDALTDTLISPMRVLLDPIVREVKLTKLRSSLANVESLSDAEVDALMSNFFEPRRSGGFAVGVIRCFFANPLSVSLTIANPAFGPGGIRFFPTVPQQITADQMLLNQSGSEFYFDVNYTAENRGDEYNIEADQVTSVANLPVATRVSNLRRFRDGSPRENSVDYVARVSTKLSDRTLTVIRGIISELFDNFPTLEKLQVIGFGDPEMERDVISGGGMGEVADGSTAFGDDGDFPDDGDGDASTQLFDSPTGDFIARIGSAGSEPDNVFITVTYNDPTTTLFVLTDVQVTEVISATRVRIADEIPIGAVPTGAAGVLWALRERTITISDIPGGITLPDRSDGSVVIRDDEIHIGGKTDVYVAGALDSQTSQITSLTDESPLARGVDAETDADDTIVINDPPAGLAAQIERGMSFVLEEGADIGSYLIREVVTASPLELRLEVSKDIKVEGADLVTVALSPNVTTSGGTNFVDANVQVDDIVRIEDEFIGGDYAVTVVGVSTLEITPFPTRSIIGAPYTIFRRSEAVEPPVVRVTAMELLDGSGAPVGTTIPYRDPVLAESRAFQNQGNESLFEGSARVGLVSIAITAGGGLSLNGDTLTFRFYDPEVPFAGELSGSPVAHVFTSGDPVTVDEMVTELNGNASLTALGLRASKIEYDGSDYLGIFSENLIRIDHSAATSDLYATNGITGVEVSNAMLNSLVSALPRATVRSSDLVEFLEGENQGIARVITPPYESTALGSTFPHLEHVTLGTGPVGPRQTIGVTVAQGKLYDNKPLIPEIGTQIRIGRPSIGSARVYFLEPTSVDFDYRDARFTAIIGGQELVYQPDPGNLRTIQPPPPLTALPDEGSVTAADLTDTSVNFLALGINVGDIVELLYERITATGTFPAPPADILVSGLTLILSLDGGPFVTLSFPTDLNRDELVDYINEQIGQDIAFLDTDRLYLKADVPIEISENSTALVVLFLDGASRNNTHTNAGSYIVGIVSDTVLTFATSTVPLNGLFPQPNSQYSIRRYIQRSSSTEMNSSSDETGLSFIDVELVSQLPGNRFNISGGESLVVSGHNGDGYRLITDNDTTSFSRAEVLRAEISRSILLIGSSDSPEEYVQLSQQNVQVTFDRSQLVDDVQSFVDSDFERVVDEEILARHLLPHFVSTGWEYVGGDLEATMRRALEEHLADIDADEQLEVTDLVNILRQRGAVSVYSPDPESSTERTAPLFVVVFHDLNRSVNAILVRDFVSTGRVQRFIPDTLGLTRLAPRVPRF
jgi:hypothetical protein